MNGGGMFGDKEDREAAIFSSAITSGWRSSCHVAIIVNVKIS
jgi:hypothetical protein